MKNKRCAGALRATSRTITVTSPESWAEIQVLSDGTGRVTAGTAFLRGDLVRVQGGRDWSDPDLAPDDLEIVYDSVSGAFLRPESDEEAVVAVNRETEADELIPDWLREAA